MHQWRTLFLCITFLYIIKNHFIWNIRESPKDFFFHSSFYNINRKVENLKRLIGWKYGWDRNKDDLRKVHRPFHILIQVPSRKAVVEGDMEQRRAAETPQLFNRGPWSCVWRVVLSPSQTFRRARRRSGTSVISSSHRCAISKSR